MNIEKLKNFLYYNWIHIAAVVFAIVFIAVTFVQCSGREEIDLGIMYVGGEAVSDKLTALAEDIKNAGILTDADESGTIKLNTKPITVPESKEYMIEQQVPEQIQVEIISGENLVYLLPKETLISYAVDESFADITNLATKINASPDSCMSYEDGRIYAIPLEGNTLLAEKGIDTTGMYIAQRNYLPEEENSAFNINARRAVEYILERN